MAWHNPETSDYMEIVRNQIRHTLESKWPDVRFRVETSVRYENYDVITRIGFRTPADTPVYVTQETPITEVQAENFVLKDETLANIALLIG